MTATDLERVARAVWRVQVAHRHTDRCRRGSGWHTLVIETWHPPGADHHIVGDVWTPGHDPATWLVGFRPHPRTSALIVVSDGTNCTPDGDVRAHVVACVAQDGRSAVLVSPDDTPPPAAPTARGRLYTAMRRALTRITHDPLADELASLVRHDS
jgi:hypothetical protein